MCLGCALPAGCAVRGAPDPSGALRLPGGGSLRPALDALGIEWTGEGVLSFRVGETRVYGSTEETQSGRQICLYTALLEAAPGELARVRLVQAVWNDAIRASRSQEGPSIQVDLWGSREVVELMDCFVIEGPASATRAPGRLLRTIEARIERLVRADPRAREYIEAVADAG